MDQPLSRRERLARERAQQRAAEVGETFALSPHTDTPGQASAPSAAAPTHSDASAHSAAPAQSTASTHSAAPTPHTDTPTEHLPAAKPRPFIRPAARGTVRSAAEGEYHIGSQPTMAMPAVYADPPPVSFFTPEEPVPEPQRPARREPEPLGFVRGTIRTFGELCITAGLVLILFVVWQLWWTDIEANQDNQNIAGQLKQEWRANPLDQLPKDPAVPAPAAIPQENTPFGIMYVPRFGDSYFRTIAEGVSLEPVLNRMGLGHYPSTAKPGGVGNFAMAGHRVTYGKPLNQIAELRPGDKIYIQTKEGVYTYTFRNFDITLPDEIQVLSPVPDAPRYKGKDRIMTLTACNPMFSARERYVAYSVLTEWTPAAKGAPKELADSKAFKKAGGM